MPKLKALTRAPIVYVIQQPRAKTDGWRPNLEPATKYGSLRFVFDAGQNAFEHPPGAFQIAKRELHDFDPAIDFLLWPSFGDPACMWAVIMVLVSQGINRLKFLYWSRSIRDGERTNDGGYYMPVVMDLEA